MEKKESCTCEMAELVGTDYCDKCEDKKQMEDKNIFWCMMIGCICDKQLSRCGKDFCKNKEYLKTNH